MRRRRLTAGASVLGLLALAALATHFFRKPSPQTTSRLPVLRNLVEQQENESAAALAAYTPKVRARLDDLAAPAGEILRQLPGVVKVEVGVQADCPAHRIVHLRDWHFVQAELYAQDLRNVAGRPLADEEVHRLHEELCLEVEAVQFEHTALLRCLVKHHGLRRIYSEGLTPKGLPNYKEKVGVLRAMDKEQLPPLRKQLAEVRGRGHPIEEQIESFLQEHRKFLLEVGAPGRLLIAGDIDEVVPLDDAELLRLDAGKTGAREDAIVRAATATEPLALIVLGGAHDLAGSVRRVSGGRCEYIRLTTKRVEEFSRR
jgi:hypothetical protein